MPKNTLTIVIMVSAVSRHSTASSYGFGVSAKIPFRSHTRGDEKRKKNRQLSALSSELGRPLASESLILILGDRFFAAVARATASFLYSGHGGQRLHFYLQG